MERSPHLDNLPPGVWQLTDHGAALADGPPSVRAVAHVPSGEPFRLLRTATSAIVAFSVDWPAGTDLVDWGDPVAPRAPAAPRGA